MAFCEVESDIDRDFDFGVPTDDGFSMNLMSNENITWTVERERGISFDLTALTDPDSESRHPDGVAGGNNGGAFLDVMRREVKLEAAESGVKETTFGHPFGGQFRPQPRPAPPSPFSRGGGGPANKRMLPPSFDLRAPSASKKRQQQQQPWDSGAPQHEQEQEPTPRALGRTRSRSVRPSAGPKPAAAVAGGSTTSAAPAAAGRSKSSAGSRVKVEAAEGRRSATGSGPRRRHVGGIDTMALTAELGLVDSRRRCGGGGGSGRQRSTGAASKGPPHRVGAYTLEERAILVAKFHAKRGRRIWRKKIKYSCRKKLADKRPRLKGRFVTQEELEGLDKETLAKVTGLGPWPEDASDADGEGSDSGNSECYSGPAATATTAAGAGRYRGAAVGKDDSAGSPPRKKPRTTKKAPPLCTAVAAAAAAAASAVGSTGGPEATPFVLDEDEDEEELDLEDGGSSTSAISSEDSASVYGGEEEGGGGGGGMERVSSSCKVSDIFAVRTDADGGLAAEDTYQQQPQKESFEEDDDDDSEEVRVEEFEPTDPVFGFMVDDVLSSSFSVVSGGDMEGLSAGVAVS